MRAFHDSRDMQYRAPQGAMAVGTPVDLVLDVADVPEAAVALRTWVDGVGERLYEMEKVAEADSGAERFSVSYVPDEPGVVWYQFVITDAEGLQARYGAQRGRRGGEGQLVGWEPPSFQLSAYDPRGQAPAWHDPIIGFLADESACHDPAEVVAALRENYPLELCETALPWRLGARPLRDEDLFEPAEDVIAFWRAGDDGSKTCVLLNTSLRQNREVRVPMAGEKVSELVCGYVVPVEDGCACAHLGPLGIAMLHFGDGERPAAPMQPGLGVLAHVTSLPSDFLNDWGTLAAACGFVDWLADAGVRYWQVLPANPTDEFGSPYAGISAFAGNVRLLGTVHDTSFDQQAYEAFCKRESDWLEPYVAFMAIRRKVGEGVMWQDWPARFRRYAPGLVEGDAELSAYAEECRREQFEFERQWMGVRAYANGRGVQIIGDMPLYVSADSADVWAHPELFELDAAGMPAAVAGCPPDAFAQDGQVWGNPLYDWDAAEADGYSWWLRRLERAFHLYDYVRLDHFIGFSRYFAIPVGQKASAGTYRLGPGFGFFQRARERFGSLPVIAEDLGLLTPAVRALVADCGFPGMDIVQFVDGGDPLAGYSPRPGKIAYTGTHDNQTLVGYVESRYSDLDAAEAAEAADELMRAVVTCGAPVAVVPLQDVLGLDDEARMNVPGVAEGNWAWQACFEDVERASGLLRELVELHSQAQA